MVVFFLLILVVFFWKDFFCDKKLEGIRGEFINEGNKLLVIIRV